MINSILLTLFASSLSSALTSSPNQHVFSNPTASARRIPTMRESAILARRMLNLSSLGTISTVFPSTSSSNTPEDVQIQGTIPTDVQGSPIGLLDYFAPCPPDTSTPTLLAVRIATPIRNAARGSNISLSLRWTPPLDVPPAPDEDPYVYSPMNMPRFSMQGYLEAIPQVDVERFGVEECFLKRHEEVFWTPGSGIHESFWARLVVRHVYWFGGFGDRAYIGWIPLETWRGVEDEEIKRARLVGEEGYQFGHQEREEEL